MIRAYQPEDLPAVLKLFYETVHTVNAQDYSPAELDAWAPEEPDAEGWNRSLMEHRSLTAWEGEILVGFADMDESGYLDRLYVHWDCQGKGIATALVDALERAVPAEKYTTHASITAKPFFLKRGYRVVKEQQVQRRGVTLTNYVMEKG